MSNNDKIVCSNIWKLFGPDEQRILKDLDTSLSRSEVQEKTGHVVAVKDVSFSIQKGETFVVMGLSGSGKSTLVRCISRLIEPTSGTVMMDDIDVTKMSSKELLDLRRNKMSMVFQHFGLFPHRTVLENIGYGLEIRGSKKQERIEKSMEVIKLVGLEGWHNHYPRELSGGMQQRVGLARAMAVDPEILIFDEPFSALDPLIRREMQDELLDIQQKLKRTMVFITHDFLEAIKMGDHIAIMKDGEISQVGTPEEIVANPVDQYVKDFCEDVPKYKVLSAGKVMRQECCEDTKNLYAKKQDCVNDKAKIETHALFINGFYDFQPFSLKSTSITPYLGGGMGISRNKIGTVVQHNNGIPDGLTVDGNTINQFAYKLSAGTLVSITEQLSLDVNYQYVNLGAFKGGTEFYRDEVFAGNRQRGTNGGDIKTQELMVGLQYKF